MTLHVVDDKSNHEYCKDEKNDRQYENRTVDQAGRNFDADYPERDDPVVARVIPESNDQKGDEVNEKKGRMNATRQLHQKICDHTSRDGMQKIDLSQRDIRYVICRNGEKK
jgi:hypothetical protein